MKTPPVIVLTGATSGLGRLAALELARKGAHLALVARNQARADALRTEIEQAVPGAKPEIFLADLSLLAEVYRVGRQIDAYYPRIDVLINNAGVHAFSQRVTSEGLSEMTAVNYLAPWLLTGLLRENLIASAPARIVTDPAFPAVAGVSFAAKAPTPLTCPEPGRGEAVQRELWQATAEFLHDLRHIQPAPFDE